MLLSPLSASVLREGNGPHAASKSVTFKHIPCLKPQASENCMNNNQELTLSCILQFHVPGAGFSRPTELCRAGGRVEGRTHCILQCTTLSPPLGFARSWQFCWCCCLRAAPLVPHTTALPQACPGAGGQLRAYDLSQLKSCSCSRLLLVT